MNSGDEERTIHRRPVCGPHPPIPFRGPGGTFSRREKLRTPLLRERVAEGRVRGVRAEVSARLQSEFCPSVAMSPDSEGVLA